MGTLSPLVLAYVGGRLRRGDLAPITARSVRHHLMRFSASFGRRPLDQLGPRSIERFIEEMEALGLAKSTQAAHLSSLRGFARWCVIDGRVPRDWTISAPRIRRPRQIPRDMTNDHALAVIGQARTDRERLIAWLMFGCGLRCVEVSRLQVDDYDPVTSLLHVTGKAGHQRHVPVPEPVYAAWSAYLANHGTGHLLRRETDGGGPVSPERISGIVRRLVADAGVKVRRYDGRSAHGLRAAAASDLYDVTHDARVVQQFLGHSSIATVSVYLRRAETDAVRAGQEARALRAS